MTTADGEHVAALAAEAADRDAADPLAGVRAEFIGAETSLVYFDGNSLGRPLRRSAERLERFVHEQWGGRLIRGWDESWMSLPFEIGDALGRSVIGAAPGQTVVGDSTTVLLYKLIRAAFDTRHAADPARVEIVVDTDNFPTDRYLVEGIAAERGGRVRWIEVDRASGVTADGLRAVVGPQTAVVVLSQIAYRSGFLADAPTLTRIAHDAGALILWDLCHSAGSVAIESDAWDFDLAVGCTYKYLNAGPGAAGYLYVDEPDTLRSPIQGWFGQDQQFAMERPYSPAPGLTRFMSGTPSILVLAAVEEGVRITAEAGIAALREKSVAQTELLIALHDEWLVPLGFELGSPRDARRRGSHVALDHPEAWPICRALIERADVIPDFRGPNTVRLGVAPLYTRFVDIYDALARLRDLVERGEQREVDPTRSRVT